MTSNSHTAFFGDRERTFRLTPPFVTELERVTGMAIGSLCKALFASDFRHGDIVQVLRLALIGGGTPPQEAQALVAAYATDRPLGETFPLAVSVLEALWFGKPQDVQLPADDDIASNAPLEVSLTGLDASMSAVFDHVVAKPVEAAERAAGGETSVTHALAEVLFETVAEPIIEKTIVKAMETQVAEQLATPLSNSADQEMQRQLRQGLR